MYFDTHAHYDDDAFASDREALLAEAFESVELIIDPGCDIASSERSLELSHKYSGMYSAVGLHPEEISKYDEHTLERLYELAADPKCKAIGEIGLDYYWDQSHKDEQKAIFRAQLEMALDMNRPVIIHDREAHGDCLEIIRDYSALRGVFHCFSGSAEMARELLERGWYLGFDGPITYKNARKALEVLEICPIERILIETDSPYLSPVPLRGKRNDSRNLAYIAAVIADIKGFSLEETARNTLLNGKRLFDID